MTRSGTRVGLTGLAVMGQNLTRNIARHGFPIAVHNRTTSRMTEFLEAHGDEGPISGHADLPDFVAAIERPRTVLVMVKSGAPVDAVLDQLVPLLEPGDTVADLGNSDWRDTERRGERVAEEGLRYLGIGVSGGEEGALHGPSLMPGGDRGAYDDIADLLTACAAHVGDEACCAYLGPGGAGHYVKTVHNGIEYAVMQAIAEAYDLLGTGLGCGAAEQADIWDSWNDGPLRSFLVEITARVLRARDDDGSPLIEHIVDAARQKGTGLATAESALTLQVPAPVLSEGVDARYLSALTELRNRAADVLPGPRGAHLPASIDDVRDGLRAAVLTAYDQGFMTLRAASDEHGFDLDLAGVAGLWRAGCIIRAEVLSDLRTALTDDPRLPSLLLAPALVEAMQAIQDGWRQVIGAAARVGVPTPVLSASLAWYDGLRRARGPAALTQAQRDLFGAHTYLRVEGGDPVHTTWP